MHAPIAPHAGGLMFLLYNLLAYTYLGANPIRIKYRIGRVNPLYRFPPIKFTRFDHNS